MEQKDIIDFRSDVLSKAPQEMLEAMSKADVGDDVFADDPTTNLF
jgi:threonine aldolase